jgi:probable blue pigment (indigoidine) exporter
VEGSVTGPNGSWFRGVRTLPARVPAFLGLLSPVIAVAIGVSSGGEVLSALQIVGTVLVLLSVVAAVTVRTAHQSNAVPITTR